MTYPPPDRPGTDPSGAPAPGWSPAYATGAQPWSPAEPPAAQRPSRRGLVVGASVAGVLLLGGGGYAVAAFLSGGGPQPEDVLPPDTLGFVKLDLDPAAGQKAALASLLDRFPEVTTEGDDDLRGQLLEPLLDMSGTDLDYARDVRPWLGDRMAVAAVPAPDAEAGVAPVLVLAVTDQDAMADALGRAREDAGLGFAVRDDFVLITDEQERADDLAAAEDALAGDADFAGDREALGGDQIALAWGDLSAAQGLLASMAPPAEAGTLFGDQALGGRLIVGVHAEDDALEMEGLDFSVSDAGPPRSEPTRLADGLPADALGALAASGVGERAVTAFEQFAATGALEGAEEPLAQLGLDLPGDLAVLLGSDLAVVARGDLAAPAFGARVTTEDPQTAVGIVDGLAGTGEAGLPLMTDLVDGGYVVATEPALVDALAGEGGLGDTDAFRAAVADPGTAAVVGYVDLAAVVDHLVAEGGETAEEAAKWSAVEALGFSAGGADEGTRVVLRITTR